MEIWKSIEGYEGLYEVSDLGRVKNIIKDKILFRKKNGKYIQVQLWNKGISKLYLIHRLVAIAFLENTNNKKFVNHINGIKDDNCVDNLEWATRQENSDHAWKNGLNKKHNKYNFELNNPVRGKFGKDNWNSKKVNQYSKEGVFIREWDSMSDVERELGIFGICIGNCCKGKQKTAGGYKWSFIK